MRPAAVLLTAAVFGVACAVQKPQSAPTPSQSAPPATQAVTATNLAPSPSPSPTAEPGTPTATVTPITTPIPTLAGDTPLEIRSIHMLDEASGWAIGREQGGNDHVLFTGDGGLTWRDVSPPEPLPSDPSAVKTAIGAFLDADRGWVIYTSADPYEQIAMTTVWRTGDGGSTWQPGLSLDITGLDLFFPKFLSFSGPQDGWLTVDLGAGMMHEFIGLYATHDGGHEWTRVLDPYGSAPVQSCDKTGVTFVNSHTGWMTRDCHGVTVGLTLESTLDGGSTWISHPLPAPAADPGAFDEPNVCYVHSPHLFSDYVGSLAVSCEQYDETKAGTDDPWTNKRSYLFRTEDGGGLWTIGGYPGGELDFISPDEILALGRTISISRDAGAHWQVVKTVAWDGQFSFVDDAYGWAVARSEGATAFVRTTNGGKTWQELHPVIQP